MLISIHYSEIKCYLINDQISNGRCPYLCFPNLVLSAGAGKILILNLFLNLSRVKGLPLALFHCFLAKLFTEVLHFLMSA
jgi:hypothetical protein